MTVADLDRLSAALHPTDPQWETLRSLALVDHDLARAITELEGEAE